MQALKRKRAEEIAYQLLDVFTTIGAPSVLQTDNGKELANQVINELKNMWPELKLNGKFMENRGIPKPRFSRTCQLRCSEYDDNMKADK